MNRKERRTQQAKAPKTSAVLEIQGKPYTVEQANALAISEYQRGNFQGALEILRQVVARAPNYTEAYNNLGSVLATMKRYDEALANFNKVIALDPNHLAAHGNRGNVLLELKQYEGALANYNKVLALQPNLAVALHSRAITLHELKRYDEAVEGFNKVIALQPDVAATYNDRGLTLQELERYDEALASYDKAITLNPNFPIALNNRGVTLYSMKGLEHYEAALADYDKSIALNPDFAMAYNNRALTLHELKRYNEALANFDKAIALAPDYVKAYYQRGLTLQRLKRYEEAMANYEKAIALDPNCAEAYQHLGTSLTHKGNLKEAEAIFHKALAVRPGFANSLFSLSGLQKYKDADHPDVKLIQQALSKPDVSADDREVLYYALGKIYDDCKRYDEAFECYRQGNLICTQTVIYNRDRIAAYVDYSIEVFNKDFLAQRFPFSSASLQPIFVVGMPRSGTTLMASILSNHASIETAGELPTMMELSERSSELLADRSPYPLSIRQITPAIAVHLIEEYEKRLRRDATPSIPHIVDKHPMNFRIIGFIHMLFPNATIIHCTRNPLDVCLSNYFQHFSRDYDYSFDLMNTGHFYLQYKRLMEHWHTVLPGKILDVSYEDMVGNTEPMARKILDVLGLPWDERCLTPHTNKNVVETASNWQVRQPIYKQSMERWRRYEKHIQPLKELLQL